MARGSKGSKILPVVKRWGRSLACEPRLDHTRHIDPEGEEAAQLRGLALHAYSDDDAELFGKCVRRLVELEDRRTK